MNTHARAFLENLSNAFGPPGFERDPLTLVRDYVEPWSQAIRRDKMGTVLFERTGSAEAPVVFLPGHVDEVGFVITGITDKGFLSFSTLGGWFSQVLLGQRVTVRTRKGDREGVISAKPPHVLSPDERSKVIEASSMFIDLGCSNRKEAERMGVRVGDAAVPSSRFSFSEKTAFADNDASDEDGKPMELAIGKAFDDRIGAFIAAEVVRHLAEEEIAHPNTVIGAATVQEEVGVRGATTAGWVADPDVVIALEVDVAGDVPGIESHLVPSGLGKGVSILTFDASMVPNQALKELVIETAETASVPYQLTTMARGGTDAGAIHKLRAGCPGIVLGVPTRHIHSHVGILSLADVEHCITLLIELIKVLDQEQVDRLTEL